MLSHLHHLPLHPLCGILCTSSNSYDSIRYPHYHSSCELSLILDGVHVIDLENASLELPAGSLVMLRSNEIHSRRMIIPGRYMTIAFPESELQKLGNYLDINAFPYLLSKSLPLHAFLSPTAAEALALRIERINLYCTSAPERVRMELCALLTDCWCRHFLYPNEKDPQHVPWLKHLMHEMHRPENIRKGLKAMTDIVPYTHEYLCREFRRLMGCTPTEYLNSLRLDRAHNLLENTHMNITEICYDVGFDSVSYFYRLFRSRYSVPPGHYRRLRFISRPDAPTEQIDRP